ncbi:PLP-dependent aminotransferase family protein [Flammeovirgaceae bacterium SG7u.111]|nr:PLP-dependent aminotransferase family protein [Flammeovirgaceae bacterium SG7u.132]WPO38412.1 PLP-dependent aminotransferase family protein [Flammeovirgaceae bacterium SG7u.111]
MDSIFSDRISDAPKSFIREILKVAVNTEIISFAGGLPNRNLFPVKELQAATNKVFDLAGKDALQYSNTEGYLELRQFISNRYKEQKGFDIPVKNILITSGSQQGLDLLGKTFINEGDDVIIEEPGYLGAIQAFSIYRAKFNTVTLNEDGLDLNQLAGVLDKKEPKLIYTVPNFQNPSGISYSAENRKAIAEQLKEVRTLLVEDDPYGALRYSGEPKASFYSYIPEQTVMLGTFSKTVVPSFRIGWMVAPDSIMERLVIAKQASDLHTNYFSQRVLAQYLEDNDIDEHIENIRLLYGKQRQAMIESIKEHFPEDVHYTLPEGGMFLWVTLPKGYSTMNLFDIAIKKNVAFVPGSPFYVGKNDTNTFRLNFSCVDEGSIKTGIERLAQSMRELIS